MANVVFTEGSGLQDSVYGKCQAPIKMFIETQGEQHLQSSVLNNLFLMGKSENFGDMLTAMTAMSGFKPVGENGTYPSDNMQESYSKMLVYETWKDKFAISKEMIEDSKLLDLTKRPAAFMVSYGRTREMFGAALYAAAMKGATTATFGDKTFDTTTADKKALFAVDHPSITGGAAQSNMFADPFSVDALGRMESRMHLFRGDNGEILDVAPDTILIPEDADLKKAVFAAIGADKDPATANNGFNYQFGRWNVITWSYLNQFLNDGTAPWVLMDSKFNQTYGGAVWNDRVALEVRSVIDDDTDANAWHGRSRFNACFNNWRFAAVGGVTGGDELVG